MGEKIMYPKKVTSNGVRVVCHPMGDKQSIAIGIWINTGSRNEHPRISGISHFLEHMVFKGTTNYSCTRIKESIEGVGGSFNGFTSEEMTCYLVKIPAGYWKLAVDILAEMAVRPLLKVSDIDKERTVILEEIKMYKDQPQSYVHELLDNLLWPGHPLGASVLGTESSVGAIGRRDLSGYKQGQYTAANMVLAAAGNLDFEGFSRAAQKVFSSVPRGRRNNSAAAGKKSGGQNLCLLQKETEQAHLAMGFHALRRDHPLKYAQGLLHVILGANSSSRLFNEIREKRGLAYEIGSQVKRLRDTGAFVIHAGVDNLKLEPTVRLAVKELEKVSTRLVPAGELKRAKEFYAGQLMISLEDTLDHMLWIGESTLSLDKTVLLEEVIRKIDAVSAQDIRAVARGIFRRGSARMAVIGPVKGREKKIRELLA